MSKLAVITGASKGIGAATAIAFAEAGYDVLINYRSDTPAAEKVSRQISDMGRSCQLVQADIFTPEGIDTLFAELRGQDINTLICNAGLPQEKEYGEWTSQDMAASLMHNFMSAALCAQKLEPLIVDGGSLLFTSSIYGLAYGASPVLPLYSAGKAAIISLTQSLAERLAPRIRCNSVAPGTTKTPAWDGVSAEYAQKSLDMTLQKEWVSPSEIGNAFVFLAETPHLTGQTIVIDAGWQKKIRTSSPSR